MVSLRQRQILIGSILGDGGVYVQKNASRAYYTVKQSKRYKDYIYWLFNELRDKCPSEPKQRKDNQQYYFYTSTDDELTKLQSLFYKDRRKVVPGNIQELLTSPLTLAVWFMDDGTLDYRLKDHCAFHLCTNCFTKEEAQRLASVLGDNFGIVASVHYTLCRGKRHARVYIGSKGRDQFIKLIEPFVLDCFKYKLPQFRHPSETQPHGLVG
ncbi:hypothetical protein A2690_01070 [Candidatus Roizmanbacteria bacterium RIFCSPHIGHO2_01_FULL_39_12b]|uniref:Homing endonuclease LAGLIDADG domain-containing protein n=1 Tax=Candidatus Roizmanbacteria bacterium RIFCSPHIGHO2_01_FULL_39_12b TaxID=1802030 RepID=A0A1F7GE17_9BACT|nr:MAG: hypothetical protein A2690_01070 [Candidatus Roizmanbacteria bacterium RIFCSPHIGHO2_01_FULL_39_12b]